MFELLNFLIYVMAAYGVITLAISMFGVFRRRMKDGNAKIKLVLIVKNVEECAEYIVRTALRGEFASRLMSSRNMTIIDMNSTDSTSKILSRLEYDFECFELLSQEEKERIFDDF